MEVGLNYSFDEDGLIRLQKDLNHLLNNLNDQNVKRIRTEYCVVSSKGRETIIDGSLLEMYDYDVATSQASTTLRLRMGYNKTSSNFEFSLWNQSSTTPTISLDSIGNAVFSGAINTSASIFIGDNIFLGLTGSTVSKGLYFNTSTPSTDESESSTDMKSAIYTNWSNGILNINVNSTGIIDIIAKSGLHMGAHGSTSAEYSSDHFKVDMFPFTFVGSGHYRDAFVNSGMDITEPPPLTMPSTAAIVGKGYIDNGYMDVSRQLRNAYAEQGKTIDYFQSTVGWTPNAYGRIEVASTNRRCRGDNSLTFVCTTTSSGDFQVYKNFTDMNLITNNGGRAMSTHSLWGILFYLYDLNLLQTLSTKTMQLELASSSGGGSKYRWLLDPSTSVSNLTTGWNFIYLSLDQGYYYVDTVDYTVFKYARISFDMKANSTGRVASIQHLGVYQRTPGKTTPNMWPVYDDINGAYARGLAGYTWGMSHHSSNLAMTPVLALGSSDLSYHSLWPFSRIDATTKQYDNTMTDDILLEVTVKCKNDRNRLPYIGLECVQQISPTVSWGRAAVYAEANDLILEVIYNSTTLVDGTTIFSPISYNDEFEITLLKQDPDVLNSTLRSANIQATIHKVGTTLYSALSYFMPKHVGIGEQFIAVIGSEYEDCGCEITKFIRRRGN